MTVSKSDQTVKIERPGPVIVWEPQPWQAAFIACPVMEVFFGGARGGGKSDGVLGDWLMHADQYKENAIGLMVRRSRTELLETHERARVIYGKIGAKFTYQPMRVVMPGGARLTFSYLDRDADADQFQGGSFTRCYIEEVGNFPSPTPIMKLMATLRSGAGVPVGMRLTGNPGGPGHHWCRTRYIDPAPRGWKVITDPDSGLERMYLPSRVTDNKYLGEDYIQRLKASGTPELVRAWLYGDWSVIAGSYFPEFSADRHIIAPRELPEHWARFRSFDWGSARPFAVHWWAVSDGTLPEIARGALVCYRERHVRSKPNPEEAERGPAHDRRSKSPRASETGSVTTRNPKDGGSVGVAGSKSISSPKTAGRRSRPALVRAARAVFPGRAWTISGCRSAARWAVWDQVQRAAGGRRGRSGR